MFSTKSLRLNFLIKLATAMAVLLAFFSLILYSYISYSVEKELRYSLKKQAEYLFANYKNLEKELPKQKNLLQKTLKIDACIVSSPSAEYRPAHIVLYHKQKKYYLSAYFPYDFRKQSYLVLTADVTEQQRLKQKVFSSIMLISSIAMGLIIIYAYIISKMLVSPIFCLSERLSKMNENILEQLNLEKLPIEFRPFGRSVNQLVARIKSFLHYKKELSVGTAHELKTPLAIMKTRNQVTLMKKNISCSELAEALRQNIDTINKMNNVISSILAFGRAEGAQFEKPQNIDLPLFLKKMVDEFSILAEAEDKKLTSHFNPETLTIRIQPLLLTQIIQNLLQNAIRFTSEKGEIKITSYVKLNRFFIIVRDEGPGIDENIDLFAPFRRSRNSSGTGLGLFLVKSAADAVGASISIKNRKDRLGAVATFSLPFQSTYAN